MEYSKYSSVDELIDSIKDKMLDIDILFSVELCRLYTLNIYKNVFLGFIYAILLMLMITNLWGCRGNGVCVIGFLTLGAVYLLSSIAKKLSIKHIEWSAEFDKLLAVRSEFWNNIYSFDYTKVEAERLFKEITDGIDVDDDVKQKYKDI